MLLASVVHQASADRVIGKNGQVRTGTVTGVLDGKTIQLDDGRAVIGLPIKVVERVEMPVPEEFTKAMEAYQAGELADALATMRPLVEKFGGLPANWARQATGTLGDIYLSLDNLEEARKIYEQYQTLYPEGEKSVRAEVGMARIAFSEGKSNEAKEALEPIAAQALEVFPVDRAQGATYGQVFLILGQIAEKDGKHQEALQSYMRTVAIFHQDVAATDKAKELAQNLKKEHDIHVP